MKCCVKNCPNSTTRGPNKKPGVSFHYFPTDRDLGLMWLESLGWRNRKLSTNTRICSDHFEERYKDRSLGFKVRLRKDAIPTILHVSPGKKPIKRIQKIDPHPPFLTTHEDNGLIEYENVLVKQDDEEEVEMLQEVEEEDQELDYRELCRNQSLLVQGLYQELHTSEDENNALRQDMEELEDKFSKLQNLMLLMTPFEKLLVHHEIFNEEISSEINKFAVSLYNISPVAYDFVQKSLLTSLPDVDSLAEEEDLQE
ncbi:hypothetical protein DMENIID0001_040540 [Sergentomyia squamirostris]